MKTNMRLLGLLLLIAGFGTPTLQAGLWDTITGWFGADESPYADALGDLIQQSLGGASDVLEKNPGSYTLPDALNSVEKALKVAGQGEAFSKYKADFQSAFEQSMPEIKDIVEDYADSMSLETAEQILKSNSSTAATDYLKKTGYDKILALVQKQTGSYVEKYKLNEYLDSIQSSQVGGALSNFLKVPDLDATEYISRNGLDLLFQQMATQETKIRQNPDLWTDSLREAFSKEQ